MEDCRHLSDSLVEFVQQDDTPCLLLMISDADTLFPVKLLLSRDREDAYSLYLVFVQACDDVGAYMDAIAEQVRTQLEGIDARLEMGGEARLDPLPDLVLDPREPPCDRLVGVVDYVRSQVDEDTPIVWAFLPAVLGDVDGFREMTRPLVPVCGVAQWSSGHHFIIRDQLDAGVWAQRLHEQAVEDALVFRFEMGRDRVLDELPVLAADPTRSDEERAGALLQLAGIDVAHKRLPEALEKYDALQRIYGALGRPGMQSLALGGSGDALRLAHRPLDARDKYRCGLAVAVPAQEIQTMLTLLMCAGEVSLELEDFEEAEGYFGLAIDVAGKLVNLFARCDSMENRGIAKAGQGDHRGAVEDWVAAKDLAKKYGYQQRFASAIDRLIEVYEQAKLPERVSALRVEKAQGVVAA